ncbi:MAG: hypothetical protein BGP06_07305 [Rhizobiales bacterium 65-9]|nr:hypothetical protein [Hyphomicrobiales bacterium]OJY35621.1 MAG: hypothetical protein BGP06_07305 [Rhizobiales bacterium 65-9]
MPLRSTRGYLAACASFVVAWALLSAPWLTGAVTIPYDAKAHFQAQMQFLARALHSGQSPFWNPNAFAGSPQIADPQSLIFSPSLLLALFDAAPSFRLVDASVFFTLAIGGLALIGFFRDRGWNAVGAVVSAIAFAFGASAAWRIQHIGQIDSYAFFAVTLWLLWRALDRSSWLWGALAGVSAGLMLVKPDQVSFLGAFVLVGLVTDHIAGQGAWPRLTRALRPLLAAAAPAALMLALPLLFTYFFATESNRPAFSFADAGHGSLHPAALLTMLVGDLFGAKDPAVDYWGPSSAVWSPGELSLSQNMGQMYFGALPLFAILMLGVARGYAFERPMRLFTIAAVVMIFYALGWYTPIFGWMFEHVPGVDVFRRPADATFLIGALLAIVAGYCVHRFVAEGPKRSDWIAAAVAGWMACAGMLAAGLIAAHVHRFDVAWRPILWSSLWVAAGAAALLLLPRLHRRSIAIAVALPAALLAADLRVNNGPNESTALPPSAYDILDPNTKNETIAFLKDHLKERGASARRDRVELVGLGFAWPNAGLVHGFDHTLGYNPLRLGEFSSAVGAGDTIAGPDQKQFTPIFPRYNCRLANLLGLRYVVSSVPIETVDTHFRPGDLTFIKRTRDGYIYENPRARPRVMFASDWRLADFDSIATTGRWPDFDPGRTVLLERDPATVHPYIPAPASSPHVASADWNEFASVMFPEQPAPAQIAISRYENTEIEIAVKAEQPGFVILNDVWHPWWTATIDGEPAPILKANVLFRAVQTPAGDHVVKFSFHPVEGAMAELGEKLRERGEP